MTRKTLLLIAGAITLAGVIAYVVFGSQSSEPAGSDDNTQAEIAAVDGAELLLTSAQIADAQISVIEVSSGGAAELVLPATVSARQDSIAVIDARASGTVRSLSKSLGDNVRHGEPVAYIESAEAASYAAARSAASARLTELQAVLRREQRLFDENVTARQDLEAAQANVAVARAELERASAAASAAGVSGNGRTLAVTSPISGNVTAVPATLGSYVSAGDELYRVVNPNGLQIEVAIPAADIGRVRKGDIATFDLPGGGSATARVQSVTASLDPDSRTATAVLPLRGRLPGVEAGAFVEVRLQTTSDADPDRIAVPENAVLTVDGQTVVFVRTQEGFKVQPVQIGDRSSGMVTILSGLEAGQSIASDNAVLLKGELEKDEAGHGH